MLHPDTKLKQLNQPGCCWSLALPKFAHINLALAPCRLHKFSSDTHGAMALEFTCIPFYSLMRIFFKICCIYFLFSVKLSLSLATSFINPIDYLTVVGQYLDCDRHTNMYVPLQVVKWLDNSPAGKDFSFVLLRPFICAALAKRWKVQFRKGLHKFSNVH